MTAVARGDRLGSQHAAVARVARPDHPRYNGRLRHDRDHAPVGQVGPVVWTWQARFMAEGDLWADARQDAQARKPPLPAPTVERVLDVAPGPPPGEATHWTGRMLAKAAGVSLHSVQRILEAHHDPGPLHSGLSWCCDRYSANVGASSRRPIVATLNRRAPMAHSATAITIGRAVPSKTTLKLTMMMPQSSR
jgi:hypothetical protein